MDPMAPFNNWIDRTLSAMKSVMSAQLFERVESGINSLARFATPLSGILGVLIILVIAIKMDSLQMFLVAFGWVFLLILLYYIGNKLQNTCHNTISNNPFTIASQGILDVLIVTYAVVGVAALIGGFYVAIKFSSITAVLTGAVVFLVTMYFIWILFHPHLVTTYVETSTSAGLDAIALLSLGSKMFLRTYKLLFGLLPSVGALLLLISLANAFGDPRDIFRGGFQGAAGFILVLTGLISPLLAYLGFLITYVLLDVLRTILLMGAAASRNTGSGPRSS